MGIFGRRTRGAVTGGAPTNRAPSDGVAKSSGSDVSRRAFLTGVAGTAAAVMMSASGCSSDHQAETEQEFESPDGLTRFHVRIALVESGKKQAISIAVTSSPTSDSGSPAGVYQPTEIRIEDDPNSQIQFSNSGRLWTKILKKEYVRWAELWVTSKSRQPGSVPRELLVTFVRDGDELRYHISFELKVDENGILTDVNSKQPGMIMSGATQQLNSLARP